MYKILHGLTILALLFSSGLFASQPTVNQVAEQVAEGGENDGMPGHPLPARPIPHHEPGHASKAAAFATTIQQLNAQGEAQSVEVTGLDALLADEIISDPLQGNYRMVELDKLMASGYNSAQSFASSYSLVTPTLQQIPGSIQNIGDYWAFDTAAGDLNGDLQDEQIAAWIGVNNHVFLSAGEMPGSLGRTTSMPAALARSANEFDVVVRGYNDALWYCSYSTGEGGCLGGWSDIGGGLLFSSPAIVSRGSNQFDVFAIGSTNLTYQRHWENSAWTGNWALVDDPAYWPALTRVAPTPELAAPAVVSRDAVGLDIFRLGPDNTLRWRHSTNGVGWDSWVPLGGMLASGPTALALGANEMIVFARGVNGALWYLTYTGAWGDWQQVKIPAGVEMDSAPTAVSPASGQLTVYFRGSDSGLWQAQYSGTAWSPWSSTGGSLASGVGAAVTAVGTYLFAQAQDGSLQYKGTGSWENKGGLPTPPSVVDTGTAAPNPGAWSASVENWLLDVDTGYFTGDGRDQVVVAYQLVTATNKIRIELYDIQNGFYPGQRMAWVELDGNWPRIAAGDADGDGVDEIAIAHLAPGDAYRYKVEIYRVEKDPQGNWTGRLVLLTQSPTIQSYYDADPSGDDWFWFAGTLRIVSGDLVIDTDGRARDEFAVVSDWGDSRVYEDYALWVQLYIVDYGNIPYEGGVCNADNSTCHVGTLFKNESDDDKFWDNGQATGAGLAAGDVNGDGYDEIIVNRPGWFDGEDWPDVRRYLSVYDARTVTQADWKMALLEGQLIPGYQRYSFLDTLAVGDLDRDLNDEIVFYENGWLQFWDFNTTTNKPQRMSVQSLAIGRVSNLVMGDFTRQSLRVGEPSSRIQNRVDTLVALLNMPPKHRDLVKDADGDLQRVEVLLEPCSPTIDPGCTHAKHGTKQATVSKTETKAIRDWGLSTGFESEFGIFGQKITASVEYSYGNNFEKTTTQVTTMTFAQSATAAEHDQIVYYGAPYQIWEYPVLDPDTGEVLDYMTVAFPLITQTPYAGTQTGDICQEGWYTPGHQPYNIWSYDAPGPVFFEDYDPLKLVYRPSSGVSGGTWFEATYSVFASTIETSKISHEVNSSIQQEGKIPFVGKIKTTVKGHYKSETIQTDQVDTTADTTLTAWIAPQATKDAVTIYPILYWAKDGYLVLDYQVNPSDGATWQLYDKPDPAFVQPWYGFPDPDPLKRVAPPCGVDKQLYSPDLVIDPPAASVGDTITITATVHNFSAYGAYNVKVRFYQGDPAANHIIGEKSIPTLARSNGASVVSINWTASGVGKQKIYAVIDPEDKIPEMHDGDDLINNNIAYANLQIGVAQYDDAGAEKEQAYQSQTYTQTNNLKVSFYMPPGNLAQVTRFDLGDASTFLFDSLGNPFKLTAFQGTDAQAWVEVPDIDLNPGANQPPAAIVLDYADMILGSVNESSLTLYRLGTNGWEAASLTCGTGNAAVRFTQDNQIVVPVCQSGVFALADKAPSNTIFLPILKR